MQRAEHFHENLANSRFREWVNPECQSRSVFARDARARSHHLTDGRALAYIQDTKQCSARRFEIVVPSRHRHPNLLAPHIGWYSGTFFTECVRWKLH